jgi:hypothetical protein
MIVKEIFLLILYTIIRHVQEGSKILWEYIEKIVEESVEQGYLKNS